MKLFYIGVILISILIILVYIKNQYLKENYENTPELENTLDSENTPKEEDTLDSENIPEEENTPDSENTPEEESTPVPINYNMTVQDIKLSTKNNIIRTCNRDNKMCYYELDKIMKANPLLNLSNTFKVENNKGYSLILSSDEDPILIQKGIKIDVTVIDNKVECLINLLE